MGFLDALKNLTKPYDDDDYYDEDEEETPAHSPAAYSTASKADERQSSYTAASRARTQDYRGSYDRNYDKTQSYEKPRKAADTARVVSISTQQPGIAIAKPNTYEEAREIADHLLSSNSVVLNLETVQKDVLRRILDFLSGVAYAQNATVKKTSANTYLIVPDNVPLRDDLLDDLETGKYY